MIDDLKSLIKDMTQLKDSLTKIEDTLKFHRFQLDTIQDDITELNKAIEKLYTKKRERRELIDNIINQFLL